MALATAYFTSRFYVRQATADLQTEFERRFNDWKWQVYIGFAATLRDVLLATKDQRLEKHMGKFIRQIYEFISQLWIVGSDDVVRAVLKWRRSSQQLEGSGQDNAESLVSLAEILIAMRRDLGYTATNITARDVLSTFINDIDSVLKD